MSQIRNEMDYIRHSLLALAREHKATCQGECNISLMAIVLACNKLGIQLSKEEMRALA